MGPTGCTGSKGEIVRFDGLTGVFLDVYVKIVFGQNGELFIANTTPDGNNILRIPRGIAFAPGPR